MTCSEFLAHFSEFSDQETPEEARAPFDAHLQGCPSCRRYKEVVERGVELLRSLPPAPFPDDFRDRVRHSIYWEDELRRRKRMARTGSGFGAMSLVAAVTIVSAVVATPFVLSSTPSVDLPAIVAAPPMGGGSLSSASTGSPRAVPVNAPHLELEDGSRLHPLLREITPPSRFPEGALIRTGFD